MNPEQGQKIPEIATEAHATTENSSDIPQPFTINSSDISQVIEEDNDNGEKSENCLEDSPTVGNDHQPGEVHTV